MIRLTLLGLAALSLAACGAQTDKAEAPAAPEKEMVGSLERAPLPPGDPDAPDVAAVNCVEALVSTANRPKEDIRLAHIIANERVVIHYLELRGADALWACQTDPSGEVLELTYTAEG